MSQAAATSPLLDALLEAAPVATGIDWFDQVRQRQRDGIRQLGLPGTRVEAWKYTALRALSQRRFAAADADAANRAVDMAALALPGVDGPCLTFVNGVFRADLSQLAALPEGLSLLPLSQALRGNVEPLRFALAREYPAVGEAFDRINAASAREGLVLQVAAGARIDTPVRLLAISTDAEADTASHLRHVILLGEGARLNLVEHHAGLGAQSRLLTQLTDITLAADARLQLSVLQDATTASYLVRRSNLRLHARAEARLHLLELGGQLVRHDLQAELVGDGARLETRGVFVPRGRQHIDTQLAIRHQALNTASHSNWRGVADDRARGVFRGAIVVAPGADGSDAHLHNKNLLLSAGAEIDTKPELEIYADEVQAAHGATVGQLDERALFYLRSRGIGEAEARALLTAAFCRAVLGDLANAPLREHFAALLAARLPA